MFIFTSTELLIQTELLVLTWTE